MAYFIVYPGGDKTKLVVVEISTYLRYELADYAVASRKEFDSEPDAITYAKELAKTNNLIYDGDDDYLD